jgi:hypothetical protein
MVMARLSAVAVALKPRDGLKNILAVYPLEAPFARASITVVISANKLVTLNTTRAVIR